VKQPWITTVLSDMFRLVGIFPRLA